MTSSVLLTLLYLKINHTTIVRSMVPDANGTYIHQGGSDAKMFMFMPKSVCVRVRVSAFRSTAYRCQKSYRNKHKWEKDKLPVPGVSDLRIKLGQLVRSQHVR